MAATSPAADADEEDYEEDKQRKRRRRSKEKKMKRHTRKRRRHHSASSSPSRSPSRRGRKRHRRSRREGEAAGDETRQSRRRRGNHEGRHRYRSRSRSCSSRSSDSRSHRKRGRRRTRSQPSSQRNLKRGRRHRRSTSSDSTSHYRHSSSALSAASSSKDDTTGHFQGGRGTFVGKNYRILRDVGLGTFGRVVQCEYVSSNNSDNDDRSSSITKRLHQRQQHHPDYYSHHRVSDSRSGSRNKNHYYHHSSPPKDGRGRDTNSNHGNSHTNSNTVAIKIVRNIRRYYESALIEGDICERVNREQVRHNKDLCARMIDRFSLPSTGHYCLVFECLGMSLYDFLKRHDYSPFPLYCVQDFASQLLEAVDFLHGFHLIHTDLKPENILLVSNEEMTYGTSSSSSWKKKKKNGSVQCIVPVRTKVKLIDFGGATYNDEKKSSIINTRQYRAPEVILGWGWSYPSDLWSVGCIIAELYRGELLFATHDNFEHLALMERAVGPFPRECLDRGTSNSLTRECFDSRGWHKISAVLSPRSIEHVRKMAPVDMLVDERDRRSGLGQLLRSLLTIDPKRRATAREALMSPFFSQRIG